MLSLFTHRLAIPNYSLDSSHSGRQDYKQLNNKKLNKNYLTTKKEKPLGELYHQAILCSV